MHGLDTINKFNNATNFRGKPGGWSLWGNGARQFDWWPDWRNGYAAIVASGPSAKTAGVEKLRGRLRVMAIKESIDLCPWADAVYGCDWPWWRKRNGLPEFNGLKLAYASACTKFRDVHKIEVKAEGDAILLDKPGYIGAGGNSGFQGVNLLAQFGVRGIILVGFDMDDRSGAHWYGRNNWPGASNPDLHNFRRWRAAFTASAEILARHGIEVINASPISALKCFRRATVEQALSQWRL